MTTLPTPLFRGLYGIAGPTAPAEASGRAAQTVRLAEALLAGGVKVLQLRMKDVDGRELLEVAHALRRLTTAAGALFLVNDRLDVALLADADGVHVGQDDLPVEDVRRVARTLRGERPFLVGLSTHDLAQVAAGVAGSADYFGFGPVFATASKADALPPRGLGLLREAVSTAGGRPLIAIGGIGLAQAAEVAASGAAMAAVIADVARATDPAARARALHLALGGRYTQ